ncbi:hypothetical protein LTS08_001251 [Lithohypha guttulata]|nr:hypothetical protein LTS08_001251 [Lithohypha guttulata]
MATILPEEILSIICQELGRERDFNTLFNCALSARTLADPALRTIYQYHELSPAFNFTEDDIRSRDGTGEDSQHYFLRWTSLWRSLIASSLEPSTTYKPYCRYSRILDFRNLTDMLESPRFRSAKRQFYARPLTKLAHTKKEGKYETVDVVATINDVGETVIPKATLLEEMSGHLRPGFLTRWISQTPRLKRMVLWRGDALNNDAGKAVADHCEHFNDLRVYEFLDPDADEVVAKFLDQLNADTILYLRVISHNNLGRLSFEALDRHTTLKELMLNNLSREAMENLNGLKGCTNLEVLSLEDGRGTVRLEELHNDVFLEVISWLSSCIKLKDITLKRFFDGPAILAAVAVAPEVRWSKLCLEGYTVRNASSASFHTALADQKHLEELYLSGNGEDTHSHDLEIMVSSICQLGNLRELNLRQVSDEFDMTHISNLVLNLPLLEEFWTSGQELSSDILPLLANLRSLKNLTLFALTQFDTDSILDFISRLDKDKQQGFQLSLMAVDQDFALSEEEQRLIVEAMKVQVDGRFDFVLWRELESEDSEDD